MRAQKNLGLWGVAVVVALAAAWAGEVLSAEAVLKVHKKQVMISPADGDGRVLVRGMAGAIEHSQGTQLEVAVQKSELAPLKRDGSFRINVTAEAGDKIIITARGEVGRQSVGTFKVPAGEVSSSAEEESKDTDGLMVIIKIVDRSTGVTLSEKTINVPTDELAGAPGRMKDFAVELARKSATYAQKRLDRISKALGKKETIEEQQ